MLEPVIANSTDHNAPVLAAWHKNLNVPCKLVKTGVAESYLKGLALQKRQADAEHGARPKSALNFDRAVVRFCNPSREG